MDREQAVKYLQSSGFSEEQIKAIDGAFTCDKCVYSTSEGCQYDDITEAIPPVDPQPKTGHWYIDERPESDREVICSNCEQPIFKYHKMDFDYRPKYCPNCGAKMVEPQEGSEKV